MNASVPDVMIIGFMKSATSTLARMLDKHPDLYFSDPVEPDVLSDASSTSEARDQYQALFPRKSRGALLAEGSTAYTKPDHSASCAARARKVCGRNLKLIVAVRDPVHRVESHIRHELNAGRLTEAAVSESIRKDPIFLGTSRYADRLRPWIEEFGTDQLMTVPFHDITNQPELVSRKMFQFLGLPQVSVEEVESKYFNSSASNLTLSSTWRPIARSRTYRRLLRPLIPQRLISMGVGLVSKSEAGSSFTLCEQDRHWVHNELHDAEFQLNQLLGNPELSKTWLT